MLKVLRDLLVYNREFAIGFVLTLGIFLFALAHFWAPLPDTAIYLLPPDMPPSSEYWFGTTSRGQDVLWQMSAAIWNTMLFGLTVTVLSRLIAVFVGMISGYLGGKWDQFLMT
ncbi:MAG: ABC transporter permease, partial [Devosia sp.]